VRLVVSSPFFFPFFFHDLPALHSKSSVRAWDGSPSSPSPSRSLGDKAKHLDEQDAIADRQVPFPF